MVLDLMPGFRWQALFTYVTAAMLAYLFDILPMLFSRWRMWFAARGQGINSFWKVNLTGNMLARLVAYAAYGVGGFLLDYMYYAPVDYASSDPTTWPVPGSAFAVAYNTETSYLRGASIYFDDTRTILWTCSLAFWVGGLVLQPSWTWFFFGMRKIGFAVFVGAVSTLALVGVMITSYWLWYIPGLLFTPIMLWAAYCCLVNWQYVDRNQTATGSTDAQEHAHWVNDERVVYLTDQARARPVTSTPSARAPAPTQRAPFSSALALPLHATTQGF